MRPYATMRIVTTTTNRRQRNDSNLYYCIAMTYTKRIFYTLLFAKATKKQKHRKAIVIQGVYI